jgi:hypothetical protein
MRRPWPASIHFGILVVLALAACASTTPTNGPPSSQEGDADLPLERAVLAEAVTPHWGATPGRPLLDDWGEVPAILDAGRLAVLLGEVADGPGGAWHRSWVAPDPASFPGDFFAWVPAQMDGRPVLQGQPIPDCPGAATIETIAPLLAPDRIRCFGSQPLEFETKTWLPASWSRYDVDPAWFGQSQDPTGAIALYDPKAPHRPPEPSISWIDARVAPGVEAPPFDFVVIVDGQFGHPESEGCKRTIDLEGWVPRPPAGSGVPPEVPADSARWCRQQFVVTGWETALGPEGRPLDPRTPQLHRSPIPPPGIPVACGGVGMPPLLVRINPARVDPVWIEAGAATNVLPFFGPEFRLELDGEPRVTAPNGVTIVDGDVIDPDRGRTGLNVCPGGDTVGFSVAH